MKETKKGYSALMYAVLVERTGLVLLLLGELADVNAKDAEGYTPLMMATTKGNIAIVEDLIETGEALINEKSNRGSTALMLAAQYNYADIIEYLIKHGADINAQDEAGNTALWMALMQKKEAAASVLLESGADINIVNKLGLTVKGYLDRYSSG